MGYHSLTNEKLTSGFADALLSSLAPDGGLYMPDAFPVFSQTQRAEMAARPFADCAARLARHFVDPSFSDADLLGICRDAYDFPIPMRTASGVHLDPALAENESRYFLELFHGPTLAFKDFAARFMGRVASRALSERGETRKILVATSGDTGGAIGDAFLGQRGIQVFILYPEGGVSTVQERQLTTMGARSNIRAIRVNGTFDECQQLVKDAFGDEMMTARHNLMSANSINVGRVVPQSFYYFWTALRAKAAYPRRDLVYAIPSGNLGNLTGGLMARRMGAPIDRFVVGHNANDPFVDYLQSGKYRPRASVPTLSNAMDIGRPNNFPRILDILGGQIGDVRAACWGASFSDAETERHLRQVHARQGYVMCPHTTVGDLAMDEYMRQTDRSTTQIVVATAHPAKFRGDVERIIRDSVETPAPIARFIKRTPLVHDMAPDLAKLNTFLSAHS